MPYRVTESDVRAVVKVPDDMDLTPFVAGAEVMVTEKCVPAGYTDARLFEIERWLAAALATSDKYRRKQSEGVGGGSWSLSSPQLGQLLMMTPAGQMALFFDDRKSLLSECSAVWAGSGEDDFTAGGARGV